MASSKKGKKNKPFSDAVMLSVMGPGHGQGRGHSKMDNIILIKKTIHDSMTEKQKGHTINMGLIASLHLCLSEDFKIYFCSFYFKGN